MKKLGRLVLQNDGMVKKAARTSAHLDARLELPGMEREAQLGQLTRDAKVVRIERPKRPDSGMSVTERYLRIGIMRLPDVETPR